MTKHEKYVTLLCVLVETGCVRCPDRIATAHSKKEVERMKKVCIWVLTLCMLLGSAGLLVSAASTDSTSQTKINATVYTPKGSAVDVFTYVNELTDAEKAGNLDIASKYEGVQLVSEPTNQFNCYSFAFYNRDTQTNHYWMNSPSAYLTDGSYVQTDRPVRGGIVVYYQRMAMVKVTTDEDGNTVENFLFSSISLSHSAFILDVADDGDDTTVPTMNDVTVLSKWGQCGTYIHNATECPYAEHNHYPASQSADGSALYLYMCFEKAEFYVFNAENYASKPLQSGSGVATARKNGLYLDEDGEIRYYVKGSPQHTGLVQDTEGNYYFINSTGTAVKDTAYTFDSFKANGLLPYGTYTFDGEGRISELPTELDGVDGYMDGLVRLPDGQIRYMEDGVPLHAGVVQDAEGAYYYLNSTLQGVRDESYAIGLLYNNGILAAGAYTMDADGKITDLPEVLDDSDPSDLGNGLMRLADGSVVFCVDGAPVHKGLVRDSEGNYYYINGTLRGVTGTQYTVWPLYGNGFLDEPQTFTFDALGQMVQDGAE